jgi:menaquinone-dependent protoporphyrinogen oxidase
MSNKVLITYASRHGSTEGIAERIAVAVRARAIDADVAAVEDVRDPDGYDGYVLGSAVYAGSWLGSMKAFIHRHRATLRRHPVWLFSSGPLSTDPSELSEAVPRDIVGIEREIEARGHAVFPGAWRRDAQPIGVLEKVMHAIPAAREALPEGDFRDWDAIDRFAASAAGELELALQTD